mmetsp:Transcript_13079/g.29022  ORF Transcript_13079/g.29022 Transcript_13079/m.29022 type:complete len:91 (+) Transcript_13079:335-607(+)
MTAWGESLGIEGSIVSFLGDPTCAFTKALDLVMDHPGPVSVLGNARSKRFAVLFDDGVAKAVNVSEFEGDPSGDSDPSASCVEAMLKAVS